MKAHGIGFVFLWSIQALAQDPLPACARGWGDLGQYIAISRDADALEAKIGAHAKGLKLTDQERKALSEAYGPFLKVFSKEEREELLTAFAAIEHRPSLVNAKTPEEARETVVRALDRMSEQPCS